MASRSWVEARKARTRQLIELGGLVAKAGLDQLTGSDRALLLGALLTVADSLRQDTEGELSQRWRSRGQQSRTGWLIRGAPTGSGTRRSRIELDQ